MGNPMHRSSPLFAVFLLVACAACAGPHRTAELKQLARDKVAAGRIDEAVPVINEIYDSHGAGEPPGIGEAPAAQASISSKQLLLWRCERGIMAWLDGDFPAAVRHLRDATRRVEILRAADLLAGAASAVVNDTVRYYVGTGYEHNLANYYWAMSELAMAQAKAGLRWGHRPVRIATQAPPTPTVADAPAWIDDGIGTLERYDRALNAFRHLTEVQAKRTRLLAGEDSYASSPYLHALAAATALAHPWRDADDLSYARAVLQRAERLHADHLARYRGRDRLRFEAENEIQLVRDLQAWLDEAPQQASAGRGAVLVVAHIGYVAIPGSLDIRLIAATPGSRRRADRFRIGGLVFLASGPGSDEVEHWGILPMPAVVAQKIAPGNLAVMGFSIPSHVPDRPIIGAGQTTVDGTVDGHRTNTRRELTVAADIDAYARAQLKDDQPQVVLKTFTRAALKQAGVAVGAEAARREDELAGLLVGLVGSIAMTASEVADTRAVTMLPNHVQASLVRLPAGDNQIRLTIDGVTYDLGRAVVPAGGLVVVPARIFPPDPSSPTP